MLTRRRLIGSAIAVAAAGPSGLRAAAPDASVQVRRQAVGPLPAVRLVSLKGEAVALDKALGVPGPLVLNFIFTTCSSTCSMQTAQLVQVRREWTAQGSPLQLVSITIDPDNDTPAQLTRFAAGFGIGEGWGFYTGRFDDLLAVQRHFDVYRGSKASHPPVLLMRAAPTAPWLRVEGFPSQAGVIAQLRELPTRV